MREFSDTHAESLSILILNMIWLKFLFLML